MGKSPSSQAVGDDGRTRKVEEIVGEVARARRAGQDVDDAAIERAHPDLAPDLSEALRTLRAVTDAARKARRLAAREGTRKAAAPGFGEDVKFLRTALPNYEILEPLDHGGQAVVYKALQRSTRRTVAIKVLLDGPLATDRQRQRFAREVEVISRLRHPNIVTLFDSGTVRNRAFFAMEYVEGVPVDDYVLLHNLPIAEVVRLFVTVCRAVSHAHQYGVIHRDLGPDNILVDLAGTPRILDFGLAKDVWADPDAPGQGLRTLTGQVFGKLPYLSPEQAGGLDMQVDVRSDIYTLGVVLFKVLAGRFPYALDGNAAAVQTAIITQQPLRLRKALPADVAARNRRQNALLRDLETILLKALAKDKTARYQSAAAFADDLERSLTGDVVEARADNRFYLLRRVVHRHRVAVSVAAAYVLLLSASVAAIAVLWAQASTAHNNVGFIARVMFATLYDVATDVDESVGSLAGGMEVRNRLLNDVVAGRLTELQPLVESDDTMENVRAALREKQGDLAYAKGHYAEAVVHYEDAIALNEERIRDTPSADQYFADLARAYRKLAGISDDAEAHFTRSIELGRDLVNRHPNDLDSQYALCKTLVQFGRHLYRRGYYDGAAERINAALAIADSVMAGDDTDARWRTLLASALEWDGDIQAKLGNSERGRESLQACLRLRETLIQERPAVVDLRHALMLSCAKLATLERDAGEISAAIALFERAVEHGEYLVNVEPTVTTWKRDLHGCYNRLGWLVSHSGDRDRALFYCDRALELAESLVASEPVNPEWQRVLAGALIHRGTVWLSRDNPERAYDDFDAARIAAEKLSEAKPDDPALQTVLAFTFEWLARCCAKLEETERAITLYSRAHQINAVLLERQPNVPQRVLDVARLKTNLASAFLSQRRPNANVEALELLAEAEAALIALRETGGIKGLEAKSERLMDAVQMNLCICIERIDAGLQMDQIGRENPAVLETQ